MQYAFKQNILRKQHDDYDAGSSLFTPTLTTNGLCYSFNSDTYSGVWKESEVTNTFNELFPHKNSAEFFQGAEVTDGEFIIQMCYSQTWLDKEQPGVKDFFTIHKSFHIISYSIRNSFQS